ncbi:MAG TPA: ABC transporter ATP-binding protein [Streptosporangiaceae bacterium]|nr:ABC transporter ATP-binding protein [Streptosporangiaceae bacterium]
MKLDAVGKRYGLRQPWIVRDVSLDISAGQLIRLEGRNGSGKSTLLRVLAGACLPSAGKVTGRPRTGYVPERFPPGLPFSPHDYLTHLGRVHGLQGPALAARIDECLKQLGAAGYAGVPMRTLSKGMSQKVAVAQALLSRPGLLVLDEAWTGLDTVARGVLDEEVAARLADGGTVVFVDHDPARLASLVTGRWQVSGRQVRQADAPPGVAPGGGAAAGAAPAASGTGQGTVVIEVSGDGGLSLAGLRGLPGVLSVRAAASTGVTDAFGTGSGRGAAGAGGAGGIGGTGEAGAAGPLVITAAGAASDAVLRALLAAGRPVHIRSVRPAGESGTARPGSEAAS